MASEQSELVLMSQKLKKINESKLLRSLTYLNLAYNSITILQAEILAENCPFLQKLNLTGNKLYLVPPAIDKLQNLQWINFSFNSIDEISPRFANLTQLHHLDLSQNNLKLASLPANFFTMNSLERLYLSGNEIEKVTKEFGQLRNLKILSLRDNKIVSIHRDICRLTNLKELHLEGNQLRLLPPELADLTELLSQNGALFLASNPLILPLLEQAKVSPSHVFEYIKSIEYKIIYERNK